MAYAIFVGHEPQQRELRREPFGILSSEKTFPYQESARDLRRAHQHIFACSLISMRVSHKCGSNAHKHG